MKLVMNALEQLKEVLTLDQAEGLVDSDATQDLEAISSTQQLLDELLGRFEDDDAPLFLTHGLGPDLCAGCDE